VSTNSNVLKSYREIPAFAKSEGITQATWTALCNTYPGVSDDMVMAVWEYCASRHLDPLKKPVHVVPMYVEAKDGSKGGRMMELVMPGIQELRTTAARTGVYAGIDEVVYGPDEKFPIASANPDGDFVVAPRWAKITVYRLVGGKTKAAFSHTEYFGEACARTRAGLINSMWCKRPRGMLAKCAEAGALRKGFPEELGGIMSADEMIGRDAEDRPQAEVIPGPEEVAAAVGAADVVVTTQFGEFADKAAEEASDAIAAISAIAETSAQLAAAAMEAVNISATVADPAEIPDPEPEPVEQKPAGPRYYKNTGTGALIVAPAGQPESTDAKLVEISREEFLRLDTERLARLKAQQAASQTGSQEAAAPAPAPDQHAAQPAERTAESPRSAPAESQPAAAASPPRTQSQADQTTSSTSVQASPSANSTTQWKIDLVGGALKILQAKMAKAGVTEDQLLAKMGEDVTIKSGSINRALTMLDSWGQ